MAGDVAGGIDIRVAGTPELIGDDAVLNLEIRRLGQLGIGQNADPDHDRIGAEGVAVLDMYDRAAALVGDAGHARIGEENDAFFAMNVGVECPDRIRNAPRHRQVSPLDDRDIAPPQPG